MQRKGSTTKLLRKNIVAVRGNRRERLDQSSAIKDDEAVAGVFSKPTSLSRSDSTENITESDLYSSQELEIAYAAEKVEDWGKLLSAAQALIRQFPEHSLAWIYFGTACRNQGKKDDATAAFRRAITLKPELAASWFGLGLCHQNQGNHDDEVAAFHQAVVLKPDFLKAWSALVESYAHQGKRSEALNALDHLRKLDPLLADRLADSLSGK